MLCLKDLQISGRLFRHDPAKIQARRDVEVELHWAETGTVLSVLDLRDSVVAAAWTNIFMMFLILIVMVASTYVFAHDTEELVVNRIAQMITSVNKMSKTLVFLKGDDQVMRA